VDRVPTAGDVANTPGPVHPFATEICKLVADNLGPPNDEAEKSLPRQARQAVFTGVFRPPDGG
jgi:hypothetical protein